MIEDWIEVELGEVLLQSKEKHQPTSTESLFYIGLEHIEKGTGRLTAKVGIDEIKTVKNKFKEGQILYGKLRPYLNKVYLATKSGVCSTDILVFDISNAVCNSYARHYMLSLQFVNDMSDNTNGVNLPRVSTKYINSYQFPVAPFPIQRAIVSKIETLFSDLDNGIANLKKAQTQLKIYRQAVLKKAFDLESKKYKIERISKDIFAGGDKPKDFFSKAKTKELSIPILANAVADNGLYGYTKKARVNEIAITIAGRGSGTGHIELRKEPFFPIVRLITVIPDLNKVTAEYLMYFLKNLNIKGSGSAIPQLTIPMVKAIQIYLPSLKEQNQIVQEIESRLSVCDKVEQSISESLEKAKALRQSILKKAFEGKLLSKAEIEACKQEADYEPASELLEKIKAEKAKAQELAEKKTASKKKTKKEATK